MHIVNKGVKIVNDHGKQKVRSEMDIECDDAAEAKRVEGALKQQLEDASRAAIAAAARR
jgi:hypothetical protein